MSLIAALALLLPACATDDVATARDVGFARLRVPAHVLAPPPAEELVSLFDERILPGAPSTRDTTMPLVSAEAAETRCLRARTLRLARGISVPPDTLALPNFGSAPFAESDRLIERHMRLVELAPWRAGVELFSVRGLSLLVGSHSLVDESERDPITIDRQYSTFDGDVLAVLGLRLRY